MKGPAFSGSSIPVPGITVSILQARAMQAPERAVAGTSTRWSEVPSSSRAIWGTARPMKDIGPQKAVTTAVIRPVQTSTWIRATRTLTPRLAAYFSPSSRALSGLTSSRAQTRPAQAAAEKKGSWAEETEEKSPIPHITNCRTLSAEA